MCRKATPLCRFEALKLLKWKIFFKKEIDMEESDSNIFNMHIELNT